MKKLLLSALLLTFSAPSFSCPISGQEYVIKIKSCKLRTAYIKNQHHFGRINQAKRFSSEQEAADYIETLSPKLKQMKPRILSSKCQSQ